MSELNQCPIEIKTFAVAFFSWWWNQEGNNTQQGFDEWWAKIGQHTALAESWNTRASEWVSVAIRKPPEGMCVDAYFRELDYDGRIPDMFYEEETNKWWKWDEDMEKEYATLTPSHWIERPSPPTGD